MGAPHVVIIGGGFGGLTAARALRRSPVRVTLIDRTNHHLFQPLLYEVATAALSAPDIAEPIRRVFGRQKNVEVLLGEATQIDLDERRVVLRDGAVDYDTLVVAAGVRHAYYGHPGWEARAPGLKTVEDALEIRRRFLLAFESAEREADEAARRAKLTFVIVGAGPTGVELAGTMSELARRAIVRDFRAIDTTTARVVLVEARSRVLPAFDPALSARAESDLRKLGVDVRLNCRVTDIDSRGITIEDDRFEVENIFWAAGVEASSLGRCLDADLDECGRVRVLEDLSLPEHPEVFVIGDLAAARSGGKNVPGIAPAAIQMGRHVARIIDTEARGDPRSRTPFRFRDKGMLATIGRARAVGMIGRLRLRGWLAWMVWATVHLVYLIGFRNRLIVMLRWLWAYIVFTRGARLIVGDTDLHLRETAQSPEHDGREPVS